MLSYYLIGGVCLFCVRQLWIGRKWQPTRDINDEPELIKAVARYEAPKWSMAIGTDMTMSQQEWDLTLNRLSKNIEQLERVQ